VGKACTTQLDLEPGDEIYIKLGRKKTKLVPMGAAAPACPRRPAPAGSLIFHHFPMGPRQSGHEPPIQPAHEATHHRHRFEGGTHEVEIVAVIADLAFAVEQQAAGAGVDELDALDL